MKYVLSYLILIISSSVVGQKTLEYRFEIGDNFIVNQEAYQHITQDINGVDQIIENTLVGVMQFEVVDANSENYTLSVTFKRLKMLMSSPSLGEMSNADTESTDSSDVTNMLFKGLLNVPIIIVMEKTGKIRSVKGGDKLIASMFESAGINEPEIIEASKGQMEKQFGSEALSNSFEQMTYFYPTTTVTVGNEWSNNYSGSLSSKNNWKLDAEGSNGINISGTANTTMSTIDENIIMTLSGTQKTTIVVSSKTGIFDEVIVTSENSGNTMFQAQNMTIPTQIKSKITYKISK